MTKKEYIKYWINSSNEDWLSVDVLVKGKRYLYALFSSHLMLEKLCKAHWVKDNKENHPPRIHNLVTLVKGTQLVLSDDQINFLGLMNDYQLEGRYPDYRMGIYKRCTLSFTNKILEQVNSLRKCLLKNLPSN